MMRRSGLSGLAKRSRLHSCILSKTTFLPFLYHTQTIRNDPHGLGIRSIHFKSTKRRQHRGFQGEVATDLAREDELAEIVLSSNLPEHQHSTLTPSERAVFERIEEDAAKQKAHNARTEEGAVLRLLQDLHGSTPSSETLSTIFDRARPGIQNAYKSSLRGDLNPQRSMRYYRNFHSPELLPDSTSSTWGKDAQKARAATLTGMDRESTSSKAAEQVDGVSTSVKAARQIAIITEEANEPSQARRDHGIRVDKLLDNAKSDVEIWRIMQREVFAPVQLFIGSMNAIAEADNKGRRARADPVGLDTRNPEEPPKKSNASKLSSIRGLNAPVQANYAYHCWVAMRQLRKHFPRSPYLTAILPAIKSMGPMSYVLGASTELYNETLFLRWVYYRDLHACADLRAEMLDRGIPSSPQTDAVFLDAARSWLRARDTTAARKKPKEEDFEPLTPFEQAWWSLEGVKSGFRRWRALETEARARYEEEKRRQESARREAELEEADGEEQSDDATEHGEPRKAEADTSTNQRGYA